jgi:hypothetical protein
MGFNAFKGRKSSACINFNGNRGVIVQLVSPKKQVSSKVKKRRLKEWFGQW